MSRRSLLTFAAFGLAEAVVRVEELFGHAVDRDLIQPGGAGECRRDFMWDGAGELPDALAARPGLRYPDPPSSPSPLPPMNRKASAVWRGDLKSGRGALSTESSVLRETPYSFGTRFENGPGTNPEELIGAAHAGCFSMAFSAELQKAGYTAEAINTTATVTLENHPQTSWTVTRIHLDMTAQVPGIAADRFQEIAEGAKAGCPISRLLRAELSLNARLA